LIAKMAVETGLVEVLLFSINPCYDMQPPGEDVEMLWADESYEHELHNIDPDRESLYELCESRGVGIDVMKVYGGGDLLSEVNSPFGRALTPEQCIEYALTRPAVAAVMVGCKSTDEMRQALAWCEADKEKRDYSTALTGLTKFSWEGHCMYCGHCAPCSAGIDIASVNKFYNLTVAQGSIPETVADHYRLLSHHASECIRCGRCEKNCPFGVKIIEGMEKAVKKFGY
jgi:predicted aldo/keto reductase-like oxidoreductase